MNKKTPGCFQMVVAETKLLAPGHYLSRITFRHERCWCKYTDYFFSGNSKAKFCSGAIACFISAIRLSLATNETTG